jgi:hypothetical protein
MQMQSLDLSMRSTAKSNFQTTYNLPKIMYDNDYDDFPFETDPIHDDDSDMGWNLYRVEDGEQSLIGVFHHPDGQDVMGCDMDEWMQENGYYGDFSPEDFEWDGDAEFVAIMPKYEGMPEFFFQWVSDF